MNVVNICLKPQTICERQIFEEKVLNYNSNKKYFYYENYSHSLPNGYYSNIHHLYSKASKIAIRQRMRANATF